MSSVTPRERREVAKNLRYLADLPGGQLENDKQFTAVLKYWVFADFKRYSYDETLTRLANLIDPTCKYLPCVCATWFDDDDEEHEDTSLEALENSENAYCAVCGYEMMTGEEGWFDYERKEHGNRLIPRFNYCPNCGARVVRDNHD